MPICIGICRLQPNKYQLLQVYCLLCTEVKGLFIPFFHSTNLYSAPTACHLLTWAELEGWTRPKCLALLELIVQCHSTWHMKRLRLRFVSFKLFRVPQSWMRLGRSWDGQLGLVTTGRKDWFRHSWLSAHPRSKQEGSAPRSEVEFPIPRV